MLTALTHIVLFEDSDFPSLKRLAARLQLSESTVRQATYRLQIRGLIVCTKRYVDNGSQTSNTYELCVADAGRCIAPASADTGDGSAAAAGSDAPSLAQRRRTTRPTPEPAIISKPDRPDDAPDAPETGSPRPERHDAAKAVKGGAPAMQGERLASPATGVTRQDIALARDRARRGRTRTHKPIEAWNARDLAMAWQQRLRDAGNKTDLGGLDALASRFRELQKAGVNNQHLDAMSAAYFADPRRRSRPTRGDEFRRFISDSAALLEQVRPTQTTGFYAKVRHAANFGTLRKTGPQ